MDVEDVLMDMAEGREGPRVSRTHGGGPKGKVLGIQELLGVVKGRQKSSKSY